MPSEKKSPRRFEYFDDKSAKFWIVELDGLSHTVTYGRTGTDGQVKTKEFADHAKAQASYEKLIKQKTAKGYVEVTSGAASTESGESSEQSPLLAAIAEDSDNVDGYAVYADWLTENGQPLGEFMSLQIGLENEDLTPEQRKPILAQEKKLLKKHAPEWLGDLAPYLIEQKNLETSYRQTKYEYQFSRGFLHKIFCPQFDLRFGSVLKNSAHAKHLRELYIDETSWLEEDVEVDGKTWQGDENYGIVTLLGARFPELRSFRLGFDTFESCHTEGEGAIELLRNTPKLEHLHFAARSVDTAKLFKMDLPNLKTLIVHHLHRYPIPTLAKNKSMSNLEKLCMFPHGYDYDEEDDSAYLTFSDIKAICRSEHLKSLKHLQFMASDIGNPGVEEIIKSGLIEQLSHLDLTYGCITDDGAKMLVASDATKKLDQLILDYNGISQEGVKLLEKSGIKVSVKSQFKSVDDEEREYLWYGDPE